MLIFQFRQACLLFLAFSVLGCGGSDAPREIFYEGYVSEIYSDDAHWMCKRGLEGDECDRDLDTAIVQADGSYEIVPHVPLENAKVDCLYIYPTVRLGGPDGNASFDGNYVQEIATTRNQAARFGSICEVYAPLYRQSVIGGLERPRPGLAYGDVLDAFKHYQANLNEGRPFVLMGHSQGAGHLGRLLRDEIDSNPGLRGRMVSALLLGSSVQVADGADTGGSFANIPACREMGQVGCVIAYASFRDTSPPPSNSIFARSGGEGLQAMCTNPANLGGGDGLLTPYLSLIDPTTFSNPHPNLAWEADLADPQLLDVDYIALPGLVTSECVEDGDFNYLSLHVNSDPGPRTDEIGGDLSPDWGMHIIDMNVAMGNLVAIVKEQSRAWLEAHWRVAE